MFSFLLPSHIRSWPHPDNYISKLIYFLQFHCHPDSPGTITSHLDKSSLSVSAFPASCLKSPHCPHSSSSHLCQQCPNVPQTKSQPWSMRLAMMSSPTLRPQTCHSPYGSRHTDASGFSNMPSPFLPSSVAFACFLCLESTNLWLFPRLYPCHCSGLKRFLFTEVSPNKNRACVPVTHDHFTQFLSHIVHICSTPWLCPRA